MHHRYFGLAIKSLREKVGASQEQMAETIGVYDRSVISRMESGQRAISFVEALRIAQALRTKVDVIFRLAQKMEKEG